MTIATSDAPVRVVTADNDLFFLAGLRSMLDRMPAVEVVGEATTGVEAVRIVRRLMPNFVFLDTDLPLLNGIKVTRNILAECPQTAVLILTRADQREMVTAALRAGARGYLLKDAGVDDVVRALEILQSGGAVYGARVAEQVIDFLTRPPDGGVPFPELTQREREILELAAEGKTNQEIGTRLGISGKTVRNYVSRFVVKLRVESRKEAIALAHHKGVGL